MTARTQTEWDELIRRLRHRAMHSRTRAQRAYWKRALERNRRKRPAEGLSEHGARFICDFEGFSPRPYRDPVGVWTIGYGSTENVGPNTPAVTRQQALARLRREVNEQYAPPVLRAARHAKRTLTQNQADALISAVYNLGPGVLHPSRSLGAALRKRVGWRKATADALLLYDRAGGKRLPGLTRRRKAERALFLEP